MRQLLLLVRAHGDFEPYEGAQLQLQLNIWREALYSIPTSALLETFRAEVRERTDSRAIKHSDLLRRFRGIESSGKGRELVARGNVDCYRDWHEIKAESARRAEVALPEPMAISPAELKARLAMPVVPVKRGREIGAEAAPENKAETPREIERETPEKTALRLDIALDSYREKRVLVWFVSWHRQWHETHVGQLMERADFESEFGDYCAARGGVLA